MLDPRTFDFLRDVADNNSKDWMDAHRDRYRAAVDDVTTFAGHLVEQISAFDPAIAAHPPRPDKCVTRLARDMRFGHGKGTYKTDWYVVVGLQGIQGLAASYAVHIEPGNCFAGGGAPKTRGADLLMYRRTVSDGYAEYRRIVTDVRFQQLFPHGIQCQSGVRHKLVPHGFDRDDPAAEDLKLEGFITREPLPDHDLTTEAGVGRVLALLEGSRPLVDFLNGPMRRRTGQMEAG